MENLDFLIRELCKLPQESEWFEFKTNNERPEMIGKTISALANGAVLVEKAYAYLVWGVDDKTHEIIGTDVRLPLVHSGNEELANWLRTMLSGNADFQFDTVEIDGKHLELIIISAAKTYPVSFEKVNYIRVGSYTKKLHDFQELESRLWRLLHNEPFELSESLTDLPYEKAIELLDLTPYFAMLGIPEPSEKSGYLHYLSEDLLIKKKDNGLYTITNLGAILFAKDLNKFPRIKRKIIRVVKYAGKDKSSIEKEEAYIPYGYVRGFEEAMRYVLLVIPSQEDKEQILRTEKYSYPIRVIREAIANALIHQDFSVTGSGPLIEIFSNHMEITNPGIPLVDVKRIIDTPPRSRNENLSSLMRRLRICEELGRGWDQMSLTCEREQLPAPQIRLHAEATQVILFFYTPFTALSNAEKVWATYLHACLKHLEGTALTNTSLRERFGLPQTQISSISRLIKQTVEEQLIKPIDESAAPKKMVYIPFWAS